MIESFAELRAAVQRPSSQRLAVAAATDPRTLEAVAAAKERGIAEAVLYGDQAQMEASAEEAGVDLSAFETHHVPVPADAARAAVRAVSRGEASVYMKGYLHTTEFLRAALHREDGLRAGHLLSHIFILDAQRLGRLLMVTDGALNIEPDLEALAQIISNAVGLARLLGNARPKVAVLSAVAAVKPTMPTTLRAAALSKMAERNQIKSCVIDGPFALDNAINPEAAAYKKISGEVAGQADIVVVPDVVAGNILAKSYPHIAGGQMAGVVMGARAPIVLPSRADSLESKLMGIVTAVVLAQQTGGEPLKVQTVHF
ncbi:MAG: bifunctional enoyl-CoA hydratase/phosphate acetyltransferase [Myxococcota bacterium]